MNDRDYIKTRLMIMRTVSGFYPIEAVKDIPISQQAKDHGELNDHIIRVEDIDGNVLWERIIH